MHGRSPIIAVLVLAAGAGTAAVVFFAHPSGPVALKLVRIGAQTNSIFKAVTVEFSNPGPRRVCFAGNLKFQTHAGHHWSEPVNFPDLGETVLLSHTNRQEIIFLLPRQADACRFLLVHRPGTSPYCRAYFFLQNHGIRTRFPKLSKLVLKCVPRKTGWHHSAPELTLPVPGKDLA